MRSSPENHDSVWGAVVNHLEKRLKGMSLSSGDMDFPGYKLKAFYKGRELANLSVGRTYQYYDIASLTKIVFTTSYFVDAVEKKKLTLSDKVNRFLPWYRHSRIKVGQLLSHSAGNEWWRPFYKKIDFKLEPLQAYQQMEKFCQQAPLSRNSKKAVYSDIDFYLLGSIMQSIEEKPLIEIWAETKENFFPNSRFHFNQCNQALYKKSQYAPTEKCSWRAKHLQAEVHDENAWALGGVAPHAGLFGRIDDLADYGLWLRGVYKGKNKKIKSSTLKKFSERAIPQSRGDWGYGFMKPSKKSSSAGEYFNEKSFGHTGFTGTSFWFDPRKDLFVCLLSNRVNPTRKTTGFQRLRPKLHNWIVQYLEGEL